MCVRLDLRVCACVRMHARDLVSLPATHMPPLPIALFALYGHG